MTKILISLLSISIIFISCTNKSSDQSENTQSEKKTKEINYFSEDENNSENQKYHMNFSDSLGISEYVESLENMKLDSGKSLVYTDNEFNLWKAKVYFDQENKIKILEGRIIKENGDSETQRIYFSDSIPVLCRTELNTIFEGNQSKSIVINYFDSLGSVSNSFLMRNTGQFMENEENFLPIDSKQIDYRKFSRLVNQQGEFENTFRGFSEVNNLLFIIVGTDLYRASLKIASSIDERNLNILRSNPEKYIGCLLNILYVNDANEYYEDNHILTQIDFKKPC